MQGPARTIRVLLHTSPSDDTAFLRGHRTLRFGLLVGVLAAIAIALAVPSLVSRDADRDRRAPGVIVSAAAAEQEFLRLLDDHRQDAGHPALVPNAALADQSRAWSAAMAAAGGLAHDPNLSSATAGVVPDWRAAAENVGRGPSVIAVDEKFSTTPEHRNNVLGDYNQVGVGVVLDGDELWVTVRFAAGALPVVPTEVAAPTSAPPTTIGVGTAPDGGDGRDTFAVRRGPHWALRYENADGPADWTFGYGDGIGAALSGDWDGDGDATPGVRIGEVWHLRNSATPGLADVILAFGSPGDVPLVGDWDGDGRDSIGVRRGIELHLRNELTTGPADVVTAFGEATDQLIVGDWNGDGRDSIGVVRAGRFLLANDLATPAADLDLTFGDPTDQAYAGDWNGDGTDTIAVRRANTFHLTDTLQAQAAATTTFAYGEPTDEFLVGDW